MFPPPDYLPPSILESLRLKSVARAIALDLRRPIVEVRLWRPVVLPAAMPKASIDEDRETVTREGDVDSDHATGNLDRVVDAIPQTGGVQKLP